MKDFNSDIMILGQLTWCRNQLEHDKKNQHVYKTLQILVGMLYERQFKK